MDSTLNDFFNNFHIGTYYLQRNARTECHIKDLKDCGIDLIFGMDNNSAALDIFYKYGIYAVVSEVIPGWFGGTGKNAGLMRQTNKTEAYIEGINSFTDHPAIIGIDAGDEPSALDFPYYGEVIKLIKQSIPNKFPYLNLYPSYGMLSSNDKEQTKKELGTSSYQEYLEQYCEHIDLPYLSFDHYAYSTNGNSLFDDLFTAATYCKKSQKRLFVILQVNSKEKDVFLNEENLCFQAFSALAYGASTISWACYCAGWWYNHVLDSDGNKTEQYEKLKKVNQKLRHLATEYIKYHWIDTQLLKQGERTKFDKFLFITATQDILIGKFEHQNDKKAIFISFTDKNTSFDSELSFRLHHNRQVRLYKSNETLELAPDSDGVYRISLNKYDACFITVD